MTDLLAEALAEADPKTEGGFYLVTAERLRVALRERGVHFVTVEGLAKAILDATTVYGMPENWYTVWRRAWPEGLAAAILAALEREA
jgi:hypothetical protein